MPHYSLFTKGSQGRNSRQGRNLKTATESRGHKWALLPSLLPVAYFFLIPCRTTHSPTGGGATPRNMDSPTGGATPSSIDSPTSIINQEYDPQASWTEECFNWGSLLPNDSIISAWYKASQHNWSLVNLAHKLDSFLNFSLYFPAYPEDLMLVLISQYKAFQL